jgi:hypothetical protein
MKTLEWLLFLSVFVAAGRLEAAPPAAIEPGNYVTEHSWGQLQIQAPKKGGQSFNLDVLGGNGHTCTLSGVIRQRTARIENGDEPVCVVRFGQKGEGIEVTVDDADPCRAWCGMRAWFEGYYSRPPPACVPRVVRATRSDFQRLYKSKAYGEARAKIEGLLNTCGSVIDRFDEMWIRNDLAVTLHHLKDDAACLKVLEPMREWAASEDGEVAIGEPAYEDFYRRIGKAIRANLKLCGAGK